MLRIESCLLIVDFEMNGGEKEKRDEGGWGRPGLRVRPLGAVAAGGPC